MRAPNFLVFFFSSLVSLLVLAPVASGVNFETSLHLRSLLNETLTAALRAGLDSEAYMRDGDKTVIGLPFTPTSLFVWWCLLLPWGATNAIYGCWSEDGVWWLLACGTVVTYFLGWTFIMVLYNLITTAAHRSGNYMTVEFDSAQELERIGPMIARLCNHARKQLDLANKPN